jgi:hypothetical protein
LPPEVRTATTSAPGATSTSGRGVAAARPSAPSTNATPPRRKGERSRQNNNRPAVAISSGATPKAATRPTAPGRLATHSATVIIHSMPRPISRHATSSKPNGSASSATSPIGITHTDTSGIASRFAMTP